MADFNSVSNKLGYDLLTQMQGDLGIAGPSAGYFMENPENPGTGAYYGAKQAQILGGFDPSVFKDYGFDWQDTGKGNTGILTAYKDGQKSGSWSQKDEQLGESLLNAGMLAALAFGGLGMAGHGPLSGIFGGSAGGAGAAADAAALDAAAIDMGAGAVGGATESGIAGLGAGATGSNAFNPALLESAIGTPGYGASSAGLGGVTAGQTAAAAAVNPYLNMLGKISPELASAAASATGGITSGVGSILDSILPASMLGNVGGADGASGLGSLFGGGKGGDWMKYLLPALAGYASYKDAKKPTLQGYSGSIKPRTATQSVQQSKYGPVAKVGYAQGGDIPRYLDSTEDGMQDGIGALIDGKQQAALSGGEFVIPADVVSHIGNGNSNAGAKQLYDMMDRIRAERTGTTQQGREIDPAQLLPR